MVQLVGKKKVASSVLQHTSPADKEAFKEFLKQQKHVVRATTLNRVEGAIDAASESTKAPEFGGKNMYLYCGIPIEALLKMLENDTKTTNAAYELYGSTALLKGGLSSDGSGSVTKVGDSLAEMEGNAVVAAAQQDAQGTRLDSISALGGGLSALSGEVVASLVVKGAGNEESIDKLTNALDYEKNLGSASTHLSDGDVEDLGGGGGGGGGNSSSPSMQRAIQSLVGGEYDVTSDENHFGSAPRSGNNRGAGAFEADRSFHGAGIDVGNEETISPREALRHASVRQRAAFREKLQSDLSDARKAKRESDRQLEDKRGRLSAVFQKLGSGASASTGIAKAGTQIASAKENAQRVMVQSQNTSVQSIERAQMDSVDATKKKAATIQELLAQMMNQQGKRG